MPVYASIGLTRSEVLESCPIDLEYAFEAFRLKSKMRDEELWRQGIYYQRAMAVAIDHCFNGRNAKSEYFDEPLLKEALMTKEEKEEENRKYLDSFVESLRTMQRNFELEKERARVNENANT